MLPRASFFGLGLCALTFALACGKTVGIGSDREDAVGPADCGDGATFCTDGGPSDASVDATALDAGSPAVDDGVVACPYGLPPDGGPAPASTKTYHRSCSTKASCAIGYHLADCCGRAVALGVEASEKPRFEANGRICGNSFVTCDCAAGPTLVEDGEASRSADNSDIDVACVAGACRTYVTNFACGSQSCDSRTQYCDALMPGIALPDGGAPPILYSCRPIPAACTTTPSCACITSTLSTATCTEAKGRVTVTRQGI